MIFCLSAKVVNSNTTNMNVGRKYNSKLEKPQHDVPKEESYDDETEEGNKDYTKVNLDHINYNNNEDFLHLKNFYSTENSAYSNYEDYKSFYLSPSNPLPKSKVKFKISSRIVQTKYGKLQGIVLAMDEHRYLKPLEVFLGVPYATPPVGSNR